MAAFGGVEQRIVELTFEPGVSVSQVAQAHGANANQVFKWRRSFERSELVEANAACLLPVVAPVSDETDLLQEQQVRHVWRKGRYA